MAKQKKYSAPISQLWNLFYYRYFRRHAKFDGSAETICRAIVDKCWNGAFYSTSLGNFDYFWIRDFATVVKPLRALGHVERVRATIQWALGHYMREGVVTLCITPTGRLFDAPKAGIDTLPSLIHCIWSAKYELTDDETNFLNKQLKQYIHDYLDPKTGALLPHHGPAELRDGVMYDRSAYVVAMVERMAWSCKHLGLNFPFKHTYYRDELLNHYWNGKYFNADYTNTAFSAECALIPFIMRSVEDTKKLNATLDYIRDQKMAEPYALPYTNTPEKFQYRWWARTVMRNYAGDTIWTWHGAYYLRLLWGQSRPEAAEHERNFVRMIERYHTFPELLNPNGTMYNSLLYKSSEGMIWAAIYLTVGSYKPKS
ncbi:MAG TPA: hypothetical protein PL051_01080 [Candidatus Saccharibacteria bacterium]|nr:hypothetical protein [Candidatus Saccharibacteria bacterium]